jgi:hypothetical protein
MRSRSWLCLSAWAILAIAGCEGTEVGNPEVKDTVTARFFTFDTSGTAALASIYFRVMRMDYDYYAEPDSARDSGTCWNSPAGTLAEWSDEGGAGLRDTSVRAGMWFSSRLILRTPEGSTTLPDSSDYRTWSNPRYAKFYLVQNADSLPALFEMPQGMEIRLKYGQDAMAYWNWDDSIWVSVAFDAGKWIGPLGARGAWTMRQDGKHARYVLFSPTENAQAWNGLKARLPGSFVSDSVQVLP